MRYIFSVALFATSLLVGCQSCTTSPMPIVGDSMSQWSGPYCATEQPTGHATRNAVCGTCGTPGCGGECLSRFMGRAAQRANYDLHCQDFAPRGFYGLEGCAMP